MPVKPFSQIGVAKTRSGKRSTTPREEPETPPRSRWTSSPISTMRGSRAMLCSSTSATASMYFFSTVAVAGSAAASTKRSPRSSERSPRIPSSTRAASG